MKGEHENACIPTTLGMRIRNAYDVIASEARLLSANPKTRLIDFLIEDMAENSANIKRWKDQLAEEYCEALYAPLSKIEQHTPLIP